MSGVNHNATHIANGWNFQSNAAIVLFIRNIKDSKSVKVEGTKEDVEIVKNDNSKIMAQVKSIYVDDDSDIVDESHNKEKFKDALDTLFDSNDETVEKLVYIINSRNPFKEKNNIYNVTGISENDFGDLPLENQNTIKSLLQSAIKNNDKLKDFDLNKLKILTIPFAGSQSNKYVEIYAEIGRFLNQLKINERYDKEFAEKLQWMFWDNASVKYKELKKEDFIWPLIILLTDKEDILQSESFNYDDGDIQRIQTLYNSIIQRKTNKFSFVSKVIYDYENFRETCNTKLKAEELFIKQNWTKYLDEIENVSCEEDLKEGLLTMIIYNILTQRRTINKIKKEVNLQ